MESTKRRYIGFFIILQIIVGFALGPIIILNQIYGATAVKIYGLTSVFILSAMGFWLWARDMARDKSKIPPDGTAALTFGIIFGFIMSEIVAVILLMSP